jgi:hypothetical protein
MKGESITCGVCSNAFVKKMKSQLYCSRECYVKAWPINNREKAAKRSRDRRAANPQWYAAREPGYAKKAKNRNLQKRPWRYVFDSRKRDAKARRIVFTLTDEWCAARWTAKCELTGIPFQANPGNKGPFPFACSLDKIEASLGYTPENCRFILWGCNALKGSGTDKDMIVIANALLTYQRP